MDCLLQSKEEAGEMRLNDFGRKVNLFGSFSSATRSSACDSFSVRDASPEGASPRNALFVLTTLPRKLAVALLVMMFLMTGIVSAAFPVPTQPDSFVNTTMSGPEPSGGYAMNTSGGTISVVNINATTQNPHWKAYVGNISGSLALQDASGNSVYDWNVTSMEGEVYATRKSAVVDWDSVACADGSNIVAEEEALNMTTSEPDSIVNTFDSMSHAEFYAGLTQVNENSCNSTNLYVNSQASSDFAELLLYDGSYIVYTALIEDAITGFDGKEYDFQMILPDSGLEGSQTPETYYFYVELI